MNIVKLVAKLVGGESVASGTSGLSVDSDLACISLFARWRARFSAEEHDHVMSEFQRTCKYFQILPQCLPPSHTTAATL